MPTVTIISEGDFAPQIDRLEAVEAGVVRTVDEAPESDFYILIDNQLSLEPDALFTLIDNSAFLRHRALITATVCNPDGSLRFGGRTRKKRLVEPDPMIPVPCFGFDTALVLIPRYVAEKAGLDVRQKDYAHRVRKAGIGRVVAPGLLATYTGPLGPVKKKSLIKRLLGL